MIQMIEITDLQALAKRVVEMEKALNKAKITLKKEQTTLFLTTTDEEIMKMTGRNKTTQKEREVFVDLKTLGLVERVNTCSENLKEVKCDFELALLEFKQSSSNVELIKSLLK